MEAQEIQLQGLNAEAFIGDQVKAIREAVGDGLAVNALSGGVDSAVLHRQRPDA